MTCLHATMNLLCQHCCHLAIIHVLIQSTSTYPSGLYAPLGEGLPRGHRLSGVSHEGRNRFGPEQVCFCLPYSLCLHHAWDTVGIPQALWNDGCCRGQVVIFTGEETEAQRARGPRHMVHWSPPALSSHDCPMDTVCGPGGAAQVSVLTFPTPLLFLPPCVPAPSHRLLRYPLRAFSSQCLFSLFSWLSVVHGVAGGGKLRK